LIITNFTTSNDVPALTLTTNGTFVWQPNICPPNLVGFSTINVEELGQMDLDWFKYDYDRPKGIPAN